MKNFYIMMMEKIDDLNGIPDNLSKILELGRINQKSINLVRRDQKINDHIFTILDFKVNPYKEELYELLEYRLLLPRGCCFIFIDYNFQHALYGHQKFGNKNEYLTKNSDKYDLLVFRRKENGECCHWGAFKYQSVIYEVIGSKNVHLILRDKHYHEDMKLYNDSRYNFAVKIAELLNETVIDIDNKDLILNYLVTTGYTFCGEHCSINTEHLVRYNISKILFFAVTGRCYTDEDSLTKISPVIVDQFFKDFKLQPITETKTSSISSEFSCISEFELQENSEGAVVYRMKDNIAVYVYKLKNYSYIFRRALREKMRVKASTDMICKRLDRLHIKHPDYEQMKTYAIQFNAYYHSLPLEDQRGFFDKFVTYEEKFNLLSVLEKKEITDQFLKIESETKVLQVIMFIGIPGSGKSFLSRVLKSLLNMVKPESAIHLEQDMFKNKKEYEAMIIKTCKTLDLKFLILSKCNHCIQVRKDTYHAIEKSFRMVKYTYIVLNSDLKLEKEMCISRIMARNFAHKNLYNKSRNELEKILNNVFIRNFQFLTDQEQENIIVKLDLNQSKNDNITTLIHQLNQHDLIDLSSFMFDIQLPIILNLIHQEDEALQELNLRKCMNSKILVLYDALIINTKDLKISYNLIQTSGLTLKNDFHITLAYYGGQPEKELPLFPNDCIYDIRITGYAIDDKALAFTVEIPEISKNIVKQKILHITIALGKNVSPVYSNELLQKALDNNSYIEYEYPYLIQGITKRIIV